MSLLIDLLVIGTVNGAMYGVLGCAFGLVYRSARIFHVAFAGLVLVPPYVAFALTSRLAIPTAWALVVGLLAGAVCGWSAERLLYRKLFERRASGGAVIVASLGCFVVIENILSMLFGNETRPIPRSMSTPISLGSVTVLDTQLLQLGLSALALVSLGLAIRYVRAFKVLWAMGDEPALIATLGLPIQRYRSLAFAVSGLVGGVATCLIAFDVGISPHVGMTYLLTGAVAILAGGVDTFAGWVIGGFLLGLTQAALIWQLQSGWADLATFALLTIILLFRPQGVLGMRRRLEES